MRFLLLLSVLLVGCKTTQQSVAEISEVSPGTIYFQGETSKQNVEKFEQLLVNSDQQINTLIN